MARQCRHRVSRDTQQLRLRAAVSAIGVRACGSCPRTTEDDLRSMAAAKTGLPKVPTALGNPICTESNALAYLRLGCCSPALRTTTTALNRQTTTHRSNPSRAESMGSTARCSSGYSHPAFHSVRPLPLALAELLTR